MTTLGIFIEKKKLTYQKRLRDDSKRENNEINEKEIIFSNKEIENEINNKCNIL